MNHKRPNDHGQEQHQHDGRLAAPVDGQRHGGHGGEAQQRGWSGTRPWRTAVKNSAPATARMANTRIMVQAGPRWNRISASAAMARPHRHRSGDVAPSRGRRLGGMAWPPGGGSPGPRRPSAAGAHQPPLRPGRRHRPRDAPEGAVGGAGGRPARWRCGSGRRGAPGGRGGQVGLRDLEVLEGQELLGRWADRWCRGRHRSHRRPVADQAGHPGVVALVPIGRSVTPPGTLVAERRPAGRRRRRRRRPR